MLLITDGEEECSEDPVGTITKLRAAGHQIQLNVVGFNLGESAGEQARIARADAGGGQFLNAVDGAGLEVAMNSALDVRVA